MTPTNENPRPDPHGKSDLGSIADELKQEAERLRHLAEKLKAREEALARKEEEERYLRQYAFAKLREEFGWEIGEPPDDLEALIKEEDGQPLESSIDELERLAKGA